ncbi:MAG: hypothetical protein GY929_10770 [Actinomycetia bacterium]|nr:hypothetical protein [Actinomycetes bacterium]
MNTEHEIRSDPGAAVAPPAPSGSTGRPGAVTEGDELVRAPLWARMAPFIMFALASALTAAVVIELDTRIEGERVSASNRVSDVLVRDVESRLSIYLETLIGLRGLFETEGPVSRGEFESYIGAAEIFERYPGVQALEWAPVVHRENLAEFERSVQSDTTVSDVGYPDFVVHPDGESESLFVVDYLVPLQGNEAAFGFDLGSNPARRAAVEDARDSGLAVASAPITLVQEEASQAGMLLLLPVYDGASNTLEERRAGFRGVVLAVFRLEDLLDGASTQEGILFSVFDSPQGEAAADEDRTLIFDIGGGALTEQVTDLSIDVAGRRWEIAIDADSIVTSGRFTLALVATAGLLASIGAAVVVHLLGQAGARAENRAIELTMELREANVDIRRSNADLEKFAYVASHDLQTPARNVKHVVELLGSELPEGLSEEALDLLKILVQSADRMEELIQGLLDFSRIQRSEEMRVEAVEIGPLVQSILSENLFFDSEPISVEVGDLPTVSGNPQLLGQLLENLLSNAIKYRHPDRDLTITVSGHRQGSEWVINVADNGLGIDPRFHERIFEMFRRLHPPGEHEGTGIGLALCKKIVEHHGGEIWVESEPGEGSRFIFTIAGE